MFLEPNKFPFVKNLIASWQIIRNEYLRLSPNSFDPWVQRDMYEQGWSVFGLIVAGQPIESARELCPQTARILADIPHVTLAGFSQLAPHSHIQPHTGWVQNSYRLHLGLVVPKGCRLRVGEETRPWQEGQCLIFEDTVEHEAWNASDLTRGVLLLDFSKPGLEKITDPIPQEVLPYAEQLLGACQ